jgi:hypothetical protein
MAGELLFYRSNDGVIATATLDNTGRFHGQLDGQLNPDWTHIVAVGQELLFYRSNDGVIATATLDNTGRFHGQLDGKVNPDWSSIIGVS